VFNIHPDQRFDVPFNDESDGSDDAFDLRDVSSDVEVDVNELADMEDDAYVVEKNPLLFFDPNVTL
jgi:hypothetical protein